ncbi:MAG: hypothetical protein PCFJNLEI_02115 [Verrucomicrobiae bacterium]|nr:hypothetical protein [Verrucomicrobiae bacterium]
MKWIQPWVFFALVLPAVADWPAGAEYRLEWQFAPVATTQFARVPDYRRFGQLIGKLSVVADEAGKPTTWAVRTGDDGKPELWFQVAPQRRYFTYWGKSLKPSASGEVPEIGSDAAVATPGEMQRPPVWRVKNGLLEQLTRGKNMLLISQPVFTNFELSFRVKTDALAGVVVRAQPEDPDVSGIYWLVGKDENKLWGALPDATPGPGLVAREWNQFKVTAQGQKLSFSLNGAVSKTVELPEGVAERGVIALATHGGPAQFADVRVVAAGREVFADNFAGREVAATRWRNPDGNTCRGFVRVVNTGNQPTPYEMNLAFHRDPWVRRGVPLDEKPTPVGEATAWLYPADTLPRAPFTVTIRGGEGRAEYFSALSDTVPLRTLPATEPVEFQRMSVYRAEDLPSDSELGQATLAAVQAMQFKGKAPARFPTGYPEGNEFDLRAGRVLGFNAVHGVPKAEIFNALGFKFIYGYTHLLTARGKGAGYQHDVNRAEMETLAARYRQAGLLDRVYLISVFDEPGLSIKKSLEKGLGNLEKDPSAWTQILSAAGLKPTDLERPEIESTNLWARVRGWKADERAANPLGVYRTMRVFQSIYATRFGNARTAIRAAFGTNVLVTANVHADHWFRGTLTDIEPWQLYSELEALDVPRACDYFVGWPQNEEYLIDSMRCALRPHDKPVDAYLAAQASYLSRSPTSLKLRAFSAIGAGARSLSFYEWGPRRFATENWYDTDRRRLRVIGEVNHAVGWVEDILLEGRPRQSTVAILFSRASELWEALDGERAEANERRQLFHLLRGLHQQPDFLHDEFLADLDQYRVIFLTQKCMAKSVADRLRAWVERGGKLIASGECGTRDELGRPAQFLTGKVIQAERLGQAYHTGTKLENDVLVGMNAAVRDRVAQWLPAPFCATDHPLIGARLIDSPAGSVVVIVNSTGEPRVDKVRVTVQKAGVKRVESLEQGLLNFKTKNDTVSFELPVQLTDVVLMRNNDD